MKRPILVAAAALAVTTLTAPAFASTPHGLKQVRDPGRVTGTLHGRCYYRDRGQLPDPRCTPGSVDPAVTQRDLYSTICKSGYTKKVRPPDPQTGAFKYNVAYPHYGTPVGFSACGSVAARVGAASARRLAVVLICGRTGWRAARSVAIWAWVSGGRLARTFAGHSSVVITCGPGIYGSFPCKSDIGKG